MSNRTILLLLLMLAVIGSSAQSVTEALTVYRQFRPATVFLANGKKSRVDMANIFLKNSALLFKRGDDTMQATMSTISRVEFSDRTYYRLDTLLAYVVDSVAGRPLFCAQRIDVEAFQRWVANNTEISSLSLGDNIGVTTVEIGEESTLPVREDYFVKIKDRYILISERNLKRELDKEHRRIMASVISRPSFSWTDSKSLLELLAAVLTD